MMSLIRAALAACALLALAPAVHAQAPETASGRQDRIEELERLLQGATDENDRLRHQLRQSQSEVVRLQGMITDLAAVRDARDQIEQERAPPPAAAPPAGRQNAPQQTAAREGSLGELSAGDLPAGDLPGDAAAAYQHARQFLLNGQVRQAEQAFAEFIARFGADRNAPEARYWFAFTLLERGAHAESADAFIDYLRRYPNGRRAPDATVQLGVSLKGLGRNEQACAAFADFRSRFPNAAQGLRDIATREARTLRCAA